MQQPEAAGRRAQEVVGLYGDPDTTWGICLELGTDRPVDRTGAEERLASLTALHTHLGPGPAVEVVPGTGDWAGARERAASTPYVEGEALVRVLLGDEGRVLVAAHHGVCDGLGLLALAEAACGTPFVAHARGIGDAPAPRSFLRSSVQRLAEALLRPPPRFASHAAASGPGETLLVRPLPRTAVGTADLAVAVAAVFATWNGTGDFPLMVAGASRRAPGMLAPDRQTAYVRFRVDPGWDREQARAAFAAVDPEPVFPETSAAGVGPRITRLLRNRLGGTAQLSNLGVVEAEGLQHAAMFPALSGPRAVAVGLVSTATTTTLSLRTRRTEFSAEDAADLLDLLVVAVAGRPAQ